MMDLSHNILLIISAIGSLLPLLLLLRELEPQGA